MRSFAILALLVSFVLPRSAAGETKDSTTRILARMEIAGSVMEIPFPVYAHLQDASGRDYALVKEPEGALKISGLPFRAIAEANDEELYLARSLRAVNHLEIPSSIRVLHDDGRNLILAIEAPADADILAQLGFELRMLPATPIILAPPTAVVPLAQSSIISNSLVAEMIARVELTNLYSMVAELTGEWPAVAGGSYSNIPTRNTYQTASLNRSLDYAYSRFEALGLDVSYHMWNGGRNIVATRIGTTSPSEIVVICAHLDSMPNGALSPGADDNASGSAAVLTAAAAMRRYSFDRTIRYVLFTGEEQGLLGSQAYANEAFAVGDNLVAVFNLDMIAWDSNNDGEIDLHTRSPASPGHAGDMALASTFTNVVEAYGFHDELKPVIHAESQGYSDHEPFWDLGYAAILAIEDMDDFTPFYHTVNDVVDTLNMSYFTAFVKATVGAVAHYAGVDERVRFNAIEVVNGTFDTNTPVGVGRWIAMHADGAADGYDAFDCTRDSETNSHPSLLDIWSTPYSMPLGTDVRPPDAESVFEGHLVATNAYGSLTCSNRLRFAFIAGCETDGLYHARITIPAAYTPDGSAYLCITNLRDVAASGGYIDLPGLSNMPDGTIYGTVEISRNLLQSDSEAADLRIEKTTDAGMTANAYYQTGTIFEDSFEIATCLHPDPEWKVVSVFTNSPQLNATTFEQGGIRQTFDINPGVWTNNASFIRLKRRRLAP